jgi:hypothetical protein
LTVRVKDTNSLFLFGQAFRSQNIPALASLVVIATGTRRSLQHNEGSMR